MISGSSTEVDVAERVLDLARHRRQLAALDERRPVAALLGAPRDLAQQRRLPDPARPVHEHDLVRRLLDHQRIEELQFGLAADEVLLVAPGESLARVAGMCGASIVCTSVRPAKLPRITLPRMTRPSVFRPGLLDGRTALVTGGGTNLGRHAAAELRRVRRARRDRGAHGGDAGAGGGARSAASTPSATSAIGRRRRGDRGRRRRRRWTCWSTTPAASTSCRPSRSPRRAGRR